MSLNAKQAQFAFAIGHFLLWLESEGYWAVFGEAFRPEDVARLYAIQGRGIASSNHTIRLAIDLILFKDGKELKTYLDYLHAGEYWESINPNARWGGRFKTEDCVHFSFENNGVR